MNLHTVIATAGRPDLLARTLRSLADCEVPASYAGTLVVENGERRGAEQVVREAEGRLRCRYLFTERANKSHALNLALEQLTECFVFFTDDDVRFGRGTLLEYARAGASRTNEFFGGPTGVDYEQEPPAWLKRYLPISARGWELVAGRQAQELAFLGFNWGAFADDIRRLGGFNPARGPGSPSGSTGQETEMQSRLRAAGARGRYLPEAKVWHYIPAARCTPEWAIQRAYRHGVQCGLQSPPGTLQIGGIPVWVHWRLLKGVGRSLLGRVRTDVQAQVEARAKRSYNRGLVRGIRQRLTQAQEECSTGRGGAEHVALD